jgi:deoxyribonuclease V
LSLNGACQAVNKSFSADRAAFAQRLLSNKVRLVPLGHEPERVAAADVAYRGDRAFASALVMAFPSCELLEARVFSSKVEVPYVSGLLAFREVRPIFCAIKRLSERFDILLANGHGAAHPRGFGLASHLGVLLGVPSVGVAKSPIGDPELPHNAGRLVRVRSGYWVSAGHMLRLEDAVHIVTSILASGREGPLEMAHRLSREAAELG